MRKGSRKMWWIVPCRSRKSPRTESRMDIEEILKMKLETIKEQDEEINEFNDEEGALVKHRNISKKVKKNIILKVKTGKLLFAQLSIKESYVIFMTGLASKGGLSALPRY